MSASYSVCATAHGINTAVRDGMAPQRLIWNLCLATPMHRVPGSTSGLACKPLVLSLQSPADGPDMQPLWCSPTNCISVNALP